MIYGIKFKKGESKDYKRECLFGAVALHKKIIGKKELQKFICKNIISLKTKGTQCSIEIKE